MGVRSVMLILGTAVLAISCVEDRDGPALELKDDDVVGSEPSGSSETKGCLDASDCEDGEWCMIAVGICGGPGTCEPIPDDCAPDDISPICSCDGVQYQNNCALAQAGASPLHHGWCPAPGVCDGIDIEGCCEHRWDCPAGYICNRIQNAEHLYPQPAFETDPTPYCAFPGVCEEVPRREGGGAVPGTPATGCNGVTYPGLMLEYRFVRYTSPNRSPRLPPCESNDDCATTEWCEYAYCGEAVEVGRCQPRPDTCVASESWPVCSCDGLQAFDSPCEAARAGVTWGSCPED
jgi:hypothetical protein